MAVLGDDVREIFDLLEWLRADRNIGGAAQVRHKPIGDDELGGAVDVLEVALSSGGVAVAFTRVLIAWLRTRRPRTSVTVTVGERSVKLSVENAKDGTADSMLKTAMQIFDKQ